MPTPPATDGASGKRVLREVGETMLMIEAAIIRAQRAMEAVRRKRHQAVYLYLDVHHSDIARTTPTCLHDDLRTPAPSTSDQAACLRSGSRTFIHATTLS
jgi:hypothetical protein